MKNKRYMPLVLLALPMLLMQSCLKDQEDVFSENASKRLDNLINNTEETLINAENGWQLDYYYGSPIDEGGVPMTFVFEKGKVSVAGDADTTKVYESHWSMIGDNGAVLSFDSYNTLLHRYSTPSSSAYQAQHGDFEFVIDSVGTNEIKVHGKKNGQSMVFRRLNKDRKEYIAEEIEQKNENYLKQASATIGGTDVVIGFNWDDRMVTLTAGSDSAKSIPFTYTDKGIRFYQPVVVGGKTLSSFEFVNDSLTMENVKYNVLDQGSTDVVFMAKYPAGYRHREDWGGDYTFTYMSAFEKGSPVDVDVTLTYRPDSLDYVMDGFTSDDGSEAIPIVLKWQKATGLLELHAQFIKQYSKSRWYNVYLWFEYRSSFTALPIRNKRMGFAFTLRQDTSNNKKYYWTDNGVPFMTFSNNTFVYAQSILFFRSYKNRTGTPVYFMSDWPFLYHVQSLTQK